MNPSRILSDRLAKAWRGLRWVAKPERLEAESESDKPTDRPGRGDTFLRWLCRAEALPHDPPALRRDTSDEQALRRLFAKERLPLDSPDPPSRNG